MSTVVYLSHLPHNTESSYVSTLFDRNTLSQIKEIYTYPDGISSAWILFQAPEDAQLAATKYGNIHFGPVRQELFTSITTEDSIPTRATNLLSVFNHNFENQIESFTVEITNLPANHTGRHLNQPVLEEFVMDVAGPNPHFSN